MTNQAPVATPRPPEFSHKKAMKAGVASFVGTSIEWYDFYVYATAAALVFPQLFFPEQNAFVGVLASFATYAVGYFVRPLGGIVFGHIGDRIGRQKSLVLTLLIMGVSTMLVGCLPVYETLGAGAPILLVLLRVVQGLAVGGEWGGAVLLAVENAPEKYKGFYGAFPQVGNAMGALLSSGIFALLTMHGSEFLESGGWRIPFLVSAVLIAVGYWVRRTVEETPVFKQELAARAASGDKPKLPLVQAIKENWPAMLLAVGLTPISGAGYYVITTFATSYATGELSDIHMDANLFLRVLSVASFCELISTLIIGWFADKIGRKRTMAVSLFVFCALSIPMFLTLSTGPIWLIFLLFALTRVAVNGSWAPISAIMSQMFKPGSRQTSLSFSYSVAAAIWSGLTPLLATGLYGATHSIWSVIIMLVAMSLLSLVCLALAPQRTDDEVFA
jgi:MFS family permease